MIQKKSDDAISPVIGVMLMIVITVVIAAVITAFATGVVGETEPAPTAMFDVKIYDYYQVLPNVGGPDLHITHLSGDAVDTKDIELRFSWTHKNSEGKDCSHYSTYSADDFKENYAEKDTAGKWKSTHNLIDSKQGSRFQPLYVKTPISLDDTTVRKEYGTTKTGYGAYIVEGVTLDYYFGDVILTPGMKLTASAEFLGDTLENTGSQFMDVLFDNCKTTSESESLGIGYKVTGGIMEHLEPGTAVNVMILHIPSNKAIFDKVVYVE